MGDEDQQADDGQQWLRDYHTMIETMFTYHPPKGDQLERYQQLREKGKELAMLIANLTPLSVDQEQAVHHVSMAIMLANAAIARWDDESGHLPTR